MLPIPLLAVLPPLVLASIGTHRPSPSTSLKGTNTIPSSFLNITCLPPLRPDDEQLCVHTSPSFWSGRSLSFFSNDITHSTMHALNAIQDPENYLLPPIPPQEERAYDLRELENKGMSGVANRVIEPGTIVLAEHPLIILHSPDDGRDWDAHRFPYYGVMIETLPPDAQSAYMRLSAHVESETDVGAVIATNAFAVWVGDEPHKAVFPEVSRLNHDCRPNIEYTWSQEDLSMTLRTVRRIEPGEELTISYINGDMPTEQRKELLWHEWGFECACHFCSLDDSETLHSDTQVAHLAHLLSSGSTNMTVEMIEEAVRIAHQERLTAKIPEIYGTGAGFLAESGRKEEALKYARLSMETGATLFGDMWVDSELMRDLEKSLS